MRGSLKTTAWGAIHYLVYGVFKGFFLRVGVGKCFGVLLCELHSPVPLPPDPERICEENCCDYQDHDCHHDNRNYI